jgi:hypothetical protein
VTQLVIKDGYVVAYHGDGQPIAEAYPESDGFEIVAWDRDLKFLRDAQAAEDRAADPRTPLEREQDAARRYLQRRRAAYPGATDLLLMLHQDRTSGTTEFTDTIDQINDRFPPPR